MAALGYGFASSWITAWFCATLLIGLIWLRRHFDINRGRGEPVLSDMAVAEDEDWPALTVLVAAKDEEANIATCLRGLLAQDYPRLQVVVIDDRSGDRTSVIIDEMAAADPRLTALHVEELPPGWFGKSHAMSVGVRQAAGELLCFTDADCTFDSPQLLCAAVGLVRKKQIDFLSVLPRLEARSFWEKVVQPVAGGIMVFWFPPQKVNDPTSSVAYANGAFMLLKREAYDAFGGHDAVRSALNEDMQMASLAKREGLRLGVLRGGDMYSVRMYSGLPQIWRGWTRIFVGCFGTLPRLLATALVLAVFSLSPYVSLVTSSLAGSAAWWMFGAAAFAIVAQQSVMMRFYHLTGIAPGLAPTYPLGALFCLGMMFNAMTRLGGGSITWRGTTYHASPAKGQTGPSDPNRHTNCR